MKLNVMVTINVDEKAWANEYGLAPTEVREDASGSLRDIIEDRAKTAADQLGTFTIESTKARVVP